MTAPAPVSVEARVWKPMAAAMGKTAAASIAGGLCSALATKLIAALLGPASFGILQTLQQLRDGAVIAATANGRTALVQGASALEGRERREFLRTATILFGGGALMAAIAMILFPSTLAQWSRLPQASAILVPYLAPTIIALSIFVFLGAILNALGDFGKLATLQLAAPAASALVAVPMALLARSGSPLALVLFLAIPAAASAVVSILALRTYRRRLAEWFSGPGRWFDFSAAGGFLSFSAAMLVSGLASTTALLAVRGLINRQEGIAMTGQFDAAWNISMTQVTLILGSVQTYYLPSLASAKSAAERAHQIRNMLVLATLAMTPVIVALAVMKPQVVSTLYSHDFIATPGLLRWTLLGDYLKVSSWVLAAPMLATRDLSAFLALDLSTFGAFFFVAKWLSHTANAADSAAMGFTASYAFYLGLSYSYLRIRHGFRAGGAVSTIWLAGLGLILGASIHTWSDGDVQIQKAAFYILLALTFSGASAIFMKERPL